MEMEGSPKVDGDDPLLRFVQELVAEFVEIPVDQVDTGADLFNQYAIESLQLVELMTAVEGRFKAPLEFSDFELHRTVDAVAQCAAERVPR
jgi:acyl carrier protein